MGHPSPNARRIAQHKAPACPYRGTWAAAGAGSSSSSRSSMVVAWSSSGSIRMLALEARSSRRKGRKALRQVEGQGVTGGGCRSHIYHSACTLPSTCSNPAFTLHPKAWVSLGKSC